MPLISLQEVAPLWLLLLPLLGQTFANILPPGFLIPAGEPGSTWTTWEAFGRSGEPFFVTPDPADLAPGEQAWWKTEEFQEAHPYPTVAGIPGQPSFFWLAEAGQALTGFLGEPVTGTAAVLGALAGDGLTGSGTPPGAGPEIGPGGAERASIAEALRLAEAQKLLAGSAEYVSNIPGEVGEAAGEFLEELGLGVGAGLAGVTEPLAELPGSLLENIPLWVPALGIAYLAFGRK